MRQIQHNPSNPEQAPGPDQSPDKASARASGTTSDKQQLPLTRRQLLLQAANPQHPMRFNECKALIEHFGFRLASMNRLHNVFVHDKVPELINLQNVDGMVKAFHVRQILNLIYKYQLRANDDPEILFDPKAMP